MQKVINLPAINKNPKFKKTLSSRFPGSKSLPGAKKQKRRKELDRIRNAFNAPGGTYNMKNPFKF